MDLVTISFVLLGFLMVLLLGGVWIAVALLATLVATFLTRYRLRWR